ncbi:homocysteine-responsive endoplasmic reticulum-resident ubiquitin-like domain member 1 protein [Tubulanus polymorphus]|uniref:homocysteine-responsive endoplasmic reticulum-resident ubiquitin-like domain member 1 protein n=1 Tax=Tubulanus polymorphus TaxID=672921 RepID=UPI003DA2BE9C
MDFSSMPVTLVVKAPNQRIADQRIECGLGWTIKKLKKHLSSVYPSKPAEGSQKLIYSGRLLSDHLMLKDVLWQYEEEITHTVHLVCTPTKEELASEMKRPKPSTTTVTSTTRTTTPVTSDATNVNTSTDGLRHRGSVPNLHPYSHLMQHHRGSVPNFIPHTQFQGVNQEQYEQYVRMHLTAMYPGYTPEQLSWLQHMYTQQMAQYMQYMHHVGGGMHTPPPTPVGVNAPGSSVPPQNAVPVQEAGGAAAAVNNNLPANNQQQAANQNMVMNAQGGMVAMDDDDGPQGDWLDWFYMICQIAVLFSMCYFYSTLSRALLAFGFFMAMYLYQVGWFQLRRRQNQQQQQQENNVQQAENADQEPPQTEENENDESAEEVTPNVEAVIVEPPPPNPFRIAFTFFFTFFTSLIPQPPAPLNLN